MKVKKDKEDRIIFEFSATKGLGRTMPGKGVLPPDYHINDDGVRMRREKEYPNLKQFKDLPKEGIFELREQAHTEVIDMIDSGSYYDDDEDGYVLDTYMMLIAEINKVLGDDFYKYHIDPRDMW